MRYLHFHKGYFLFFILLLIAEVLIALYIHDEFIRPYFGDFLVVILIYCFLKSFFKIPVIPALIGVLLFSYLIETLQFFNFTEVLGLAENKLAVTILGNSFSPEDLVAYTAGILFVFFLESLFPPPASDKFTPDSIS